MKEDRAGRTTYCYNALNQLTTEIREEGSAETVLRKAYQYDKRGNLTRITENGQMTQQYVYGALNRLEEAVNGAGKAAKYQYNGLGHRVGKAEGRLPADQTGKLDPQSRIDREIGNLTQIRYTIDLTREYHNLLEKTEGEKR
nr:RHS repeat protein [Lachnoclostridium sp. An76]